MIQLRDPYKRKYKDGYLSNEKINDIGDLKYERPFIDIFGTNLCFI